MTTGPRRRRTTTATCWTESSNSLRRHRSTMSGASCSCRLDLGAAPRSRRWWPVPRGTRQGGPSALCRRRHSASSPPTDRRRRRHQSSTSPRVQLPPPAESESHHRHRRRRRGGGVLTPARPAGRPGVRHAHRGWAGATRPAVAQPGAV